ncbi:unnamed protein product [Auanema sp. JU1783]|nr:unnamed protein product [Auanema sp. JU1783]
MLYMGLLINTFVIFSSFATDDRKLYFPPPMSTINDTLTCIKGYGSNSTINCNGARFVKTRGFYQPCSRHSHCYKSREPSDWCIMSSNYRWMNAGCHCDKKLKSCLIERYDSETRGHEWAYCVPNSEFFCDNWIDSRKNTIPN